MEIEIRLTDKVSRKATAIKLRLEEIDNLDSRQTDGVFKDLISKLKSELLKVPPFTPAPLVNISTNRIERHECLHSNCPKCNCTGIERLTGKLCIHNISCSCPKCSVR